MRAGGWEFEFFGRVAEERGDLGGLFGLGADGAAFEGAFAAAVCACGDRFGAGFGHFGGCFFPVEVVWLWLIDCELVG